MHDHISAHTRFFLWIDVYRGCPRQVWWEIGFEAQSDLYFDFRPFCHHAIVVLRQSYCHKTRQPRSTCSARLHGTRKFTRLVKVMPEQVTMLNFKYRQQNIQIKQAGRNTSQREPYVRKGVLNTIMEDEHTQKMGRQHEQGTWLHQQKRNMFFGGGLMAL